ncbi:hypothetical protein GOBAR_DD11912 [Gossypium barbadense]|nr:hypothetical protein GOBAR_DD11912 [Gossypium barbadense]
MASASVLFAATGLGSMVRVKSTRLFVKSSLDTNVSDMSVNDTWIVYLAAPKGLFPPEPEHYRGPKLKVAIIGAGLAGMSTAVELLDQGHEVDIFESRPFIGGKVGSFVDRKGNHIEMGLHVFFGCYNNLFRLMKKTYDKARNAVALALSPVVKALVDPDGAMRDIRDLDSISFSDWFLSKGGTRMSIQRMWDPVAYALGFIDCDNISARCMLTIFSLFATKTEASLLRMLKGSPDVYLSGPIRNYITERGGRIFTVTTILTQSWLLITILFLSSFGSQLNIYFSVIKFHMRWGCREILYDKFADGEIYVTGLAMSKELVYFYNSVETSPASVLTELLLVWMVSFRCVLTPGDPYMPLPNDEIIKRVAKQVRLLRNPSS